MPACSTTPSPEPLVRSRRTDAQKVLWFATRYGAPGTIQDLHLIDKHAERPPFGTSLGCVLRAAHVLVAVIDGKSVVFMDKG